MCGFAKVLSMKDKLWVIRVFLGEYEHNWVGTGSGYVYYWVGLADNRMLPQS